MDFFSLLQVSGQNVGHSDLVVCVFTRCTHALNNISIADLVGGQHIRLIVYDTLITLSSQEVPIHQLISHRLYNTGDISGKWKGSLCNIGQ